MFLLMSHLQIFKALADPTRNAVFAKLADGQFNASQLRDGLDITQPAMSQHLAVLKDAGLVTAEKQGRAVNYAINPDGLAEISRWLSKYRAFWPAKINSLKLVLEEMDDD